MLNRITMTGRLCADPELRTTQNNISVCSFRIANDRDYRRDGETETDFFDAVAWRASAEFICRYFKKGRLITVDGRLQTRTWTDKQGASRTAAEIVVDNAYFGDSKKDDAGSGGTSPRSASLPAATGPTPGRLPPEATRRTFDLSGKIRKGEAPASPLPMI